jgi:hypothetical protein
MDFLSQITVPKKITIGIVGALSVGIIGGRLFMRFVYNIFLRYFDSIESNQVEIKKDIKTLYDRTDNHDEVRRTIDYCLEKNRKKN